MLSSKLSKSLLMISLKDYHWHKNCLQSSSMGDAFASCCDVYDKLFGAFFFDGHCKSMRLLVNCQISSISSETGEFAALVATGAPNHVNVVHYLVTTIIFSCAIRSQHISACWS
jgi:hypothetical protein